MSHAVSIRPRWSLTPGAILLPSADRKRKSKLVSVARKLKPFRLFLLACVLHASAQTAPHPRGSTLADAEPSRTQVSRAISLSADYLIRACGPDGKFVYQVDIDSGREIRLYDIVRHAGAMYAMGMLEHDAPDQRVADALLRAGAYLRQNYIGPGGHEGTLAVYSHRKPQGSLPILGGVGLGLVALAAVNEVRPNSVPLAEMQALGRFALFVQKSDGSFNPDPSHNEPVIVDSPFFPGEAVLGFITLYEADHSPDWLMAATRALSYLARQRAGVSRAPVDHWALIATSRLLPYCDRGPCSAFREELITAGVQNCTSILKEQINRPSDALDGAFDEFGRITPTAARMEGLLAALEFLPDSHARLRAEIESAVKRGIAFLLRVQIQSGPYQGGMPGAYSKAVPEASQVRIDYLQHPMCAWIRYQRRFKLPADAGM